MSVTLFFSNLFKLNLMGAGGFIYRSKIKGKLSTIVFKSKFAISL